MGLSALALALLLLLVMPVGAGATGAAPAFDAHGSVEQVYATGVPAGAQVTLLGAGGNVVGRKSADSLGGVLFREVKPGSGYRLEVGSGAQRSGPLTVLSQKSAPPSTSIYNQKIEPHGYQYLTTRDGTKLAIDVHPPEDVLKILTGMVPSEGGSGTPELPKLPELPLGELEEKLKEIPGLGEVLEKLTGLAQGRSVNPHAKRSLRSLLLSNATETTNASSEPKSSAVEAPYIPTGPTPTLIEYGGYGFANPAGPENGISLIANLLGFTVVDVNMRGTGCSGGAYDFFEPLQNLDGYDVVETIAHQPWALHHEVGMMGISYGGISQLFTAATRPPSLAAITPLSVIDNTQTTLYPGGILNTGFALEWAKERVHDAEAAGPDSGQAWSYKQIQGGDNTCKENQTLHPEAVNLLKKVEENSHYKPAVADPLSPITFVKKIDVPTYMACQWTDEQTGGHCPDLAEHMTGTRQKWFTFTNGAHIDSLDPATFNRWVDFLEIYVAKQSPLAAGVVAHAAAPLVFEEAFGIKGLTLPPDPVQLLPTYATAKAAFEGNKQVRVLFDNGAGGTSPGQPYPGFEESFNEFPIPGTKATSWYLSPGGNLKPKPPAGQHADQFSWDAGALPLQDFTGDTGSAENGLWTETPDYHWEQNPPGSAVSYLTAPLDPEHDRDRRRSGERLGEELDPERRPAGDRERGAPGRQGDLRPERLGAGERAQARRGEVDQARAGPQPARIRRRTDARQRIRQGDDPALLRGPRLPRRLPHPGHDRCPQRHPADLGLRTDPALRQGRRGDRLLQAGPLEPLAPGGPRRQRADRPAAVSRPARRALPRLRAARQPLRDALARAPAGG